MLINQRSIGTTIVDINLVMAILIKTQYVPKMVLLESMSKVHSLKDDFIKSNFGSTLDLWITKFNSVQHFAN